MSKINNSEFLINAEGRNATFRKKRDVIIWRTPGLDYIEMYVNPEEIRIEQNKVAQTTRTKAGFVYQYAGESLTTISIGGTTGSSGIEGINLLEKVYRAEQIRFERIASGMEDQQALSRSSSSIGSMFQGIMGGGLSGIVSGAAQTASSMLGLDPFDQEFPTLATLASAVEMHHQGIVYRGYFTNFSSTESANSPGIFNYSIGFTSYAKSGERVNFMPWHRRPNGQSDSSSKSNFSILDVDRAEDGVELQDQPAPDPEQQDTNRFNIGKFDITGLGADLTKNPRNR